MCACCFDLTGGGTRCCHCSHDGFVDAMAPISYSIGGEQLHHALVGYKRYTGCARPISHGWAGGGAVAPPAPTTSACLAQAAAVDGFDVVTTVPSSDARRDATHPLHQLVGELVNRSRRGTSASCAGPTRPSSLTGFTPSATGRARTSRRRSGAAHRRHLDDGRQRPSAAAALKAAGAERVAAVVIGRYVNREWGHNDRQLRRLRRPFDWRRCALCGGAGPAVPSTGTGGGLEPHGGR